MSIECEPGELPLSGVLVAEFCNVAAGPFCGMLLADMGAEVIKIEPKEGDMLRHWPPHTGGFSENFASLNRSKRSIALDLKQSGDRETAWRIMCKADVLIDVPMLATTLAIAALQTSEYFGTGQDPKPLGSAHPRNAPYQAFRARDRFFVIAAGNDKLWATVCGIVGKRELVADPRFLSVRNRAQNQDELAEILERIFMTRDAAEWLAEFERAGVPSSLINTYSEAVADAQVQANDWVRNLTLPGGAVTRTFASPLAFDGKNAAIRKGPPSLDEDRAAILAMIRDPVLGTVK